MDRDMDGDKRPAMRQVMRRWMEVVNDVEGETGCQNLDVPVAGDEETKTHRKTRKSVENRCRKNVKKTRKNAVS